ncbi:HEAT repeat domain-containing protein, partial [Planctomycetota bacterium]
RAQAAHGLGALCEKGLKLKPETVSALESALEDKHPDVVIQAALSLKICSSKKSETQLLKILKANQKREDGYDMAIRSAVIQALATCSDNKTGKAVKALIPELEKHEDLSYDNTITAVLMKIGDPSALPALQKHLEKLLARKPKDRGETVGSSSQSCT